MNAHLHWTNAPSRLLPRVKLALILPVIVLLVIGVLCFRSVRGFTRDAAAVAHTHELLAHLASASGAAKELDGATRNFVLTGDNACLQPYFVAQRTLDQELKYARRMTLEDSAQQQRLTGLRPLIQHELKITGDTIAERRTGDRESALVRIQTGRGEAAMHRLVIGIQEIDNAARVLLEQQRATAERSGRMTQVVILLAIVCAAVWAAVASIAIHRDIAARHQAEQQREIVVEQLREALATVKTLKGLLPMCAWCKNVRDDKGYWKEIEDYIRDHTEADFTHGICPGCMANQQQEMEAQFATTAK